MDYPVETFSEAERARLAPHFSNLDRPVFALVNLPETVKAAMFARYSRYPGTLRRLFLDEFADDLPDYSGGAAIQAAARHRETQAQDHATPQGHTAAEVEGARAAQLYERIFLGYGDDSVAQLGGAHVACEWTSNVVTKLLQRPRLGAYLEQSTRYIAYDSPMPGGGYRFFRDPELGPAYDAAMTTLFETYAHALPRVSAWAADTFPASSDDSPAAHARAVRAKALDLLRGLLPAASMSHMGIFASGQTYERLILHLLAHPLPEARAYGRMILEAVQAVIPSFVTRVERADRGGEWIDFLAQRERSARGWVARLGLGERPGVDPDVGARPSVRLLEVEGDEDRLLAALLFEHAGVCEGDAMAAVAGLDHASRAAMLGDLMGDRANRRHLPGRGMEALRYRFEIVADYGAFRDLQRHRMLTVQWQTLTPHLGAGLPEEVAMAGCADDYLRALEVSREEWARLMAAGLESRAPYALCLGYRIRFILDLNARAAMSLIELRSGREGHPSYRAVAHEMHAQIAAVHPAVAEAMHHVDTGSEPRLERILAEMRSHARQSSS